MDLWEFPYWVILKPHSVLRPDAEDEEIGMKHSLSRVIACSNLAPLTQTLHCNFLKAHYLIQS